jgi:hypothetical protein
MGVHILELLPPPLLLICSMSSIHPLQTFFNVVDNKYFNIYVYFILITSTYFHHKQII